MKKFLGVIIVGFVMLSVTANAQTVVYEEMGDVVKMTKYFEGTDQIQEEGFFKDGKSHGQWTQYTVNGEIAIEATYVYGKKEGIWFVWSGDRDSLYEVVYLDNRISETKSWALNERNLHVTK
jgi:antitoxin component YwqK of YwqJK toxin-antitoxin module